MTPEQMGPDETITSGASKDIDASVTLPEQAEIKGLLLQGFAAIALTLWWAMLLVLGAEIDTGDARSVLRSSLTFRNPTTNAHTIDHRWVATLTIEGQNPIYITNIARLTNQTSLPSVRTIMQIEWREQFQVIFNLLFCWTWPNLVWIGACASGLGAILRCSGAYLRPMVYSLWVGLLNGMCLTALTACVRIVGGSGIGDVFGIGRSTIMAERQIELAFFITFLGIILGFKDLNPITIFQIVYEKLTAKK